MLCKCNSDYLRRKLLEVGPGVDPNSCPGVSRPVRGTRHAYMYMLSLDRNNNVASVNPTNNLTAAGSRKTQRRLLDRKQRQNYNMNNKSCYRCGKEGHFDRYQCCPARGKTCNFCNGKNNFFRGLSNKNRPKGGFIKCTALTSTAIICFALPAACCRLTLSKCVWDVSLDVMIDPGCTHNIVDEYTWATLIKSNQIKSNQVLFSHT